MSVWGEWEGDATRTGIWCVDQLHGRRIILMQEALVTLFFNNYPDHLVLLMLAGPDDYGSYWYRRETNKQTSRNKDLMTRSAF